MKLLLTGANGQVGRELRRSLSPLGEIVAGSRDGRLHDGGHGEAIDLAAPAALVAALERVRPDVIVNAAAWTAVDRAEDEPGPAHAVNAQAVAALARWASAHAVPVVHYSTDYVFNGKSDRAWREDDATAPLGAYGASKLAGEEELLASGAPCLLFRTAWVYAAHGHNFLRTMLRLGAERDTLQVVDDQHGTPTPAALIAEVTATCLRQWLAADAARREELSGIYHLVADGDTTWYGFACAIMRKAVAAGLLPRAPDITPIGSDRFPTRARRPAWSVLDTTRLRTTFGITLPGWQQGLDRVIAELAAQRDP